MGWIRAGLWRALYTLSQITSQFAILTLDNISPANVLPHFTFYTLPTGQNDAGSWYHSRVVYIVDSTPILGVGEKLILYWGTEPTIRTDLRRVLCIKDNVFSFGEQGDNEVILTISIQSDSSALAGAVKILLEMAGFTSTTLDKPRKVLFKNTRERDIENMQLVNYDTTLQLILSAINNMGTSQSSSILDFETDFVSLHSGTIPLLNNGTGQYHIIGDDKKI